MFFIGGAFIGDKAATRGEILAKRRPLRRRSMKARVQSDWRPGRWFERHESRRMLSTVTWISTAGGAWNTAADWSTHALPQAGDDVVINQPGNISITVNQSVTVNSVTLTGDALAIQTGATLFTGGAVNNSGNITVNAASQLDVGGAFTGAAGSILSQPGGGNAAFPVANQFVNAGFESPVISANGTTAPTSWPSWGGSYLSKQFAYSGVQSIQTSGANSGVLQNFSVTPGMSYTLSAYAMTPSTNPLTGSEEGSLQLIYLTSTGAQISNYSPPNAVQVLSSTSPAGGPLAGSIAGQGWNLFSTTAVAPSNAASVNAILAVGAYNGSGPGGGSVYWDAPQFGLAAPGPSKVTAATFSNAGTITVGPTNTITVTGGFTQSSTGTLDTQLGGSPASGIFGYVSAGGAASLGGTLKSDIVYGYVPTNSDVFTVMEYPGETGTFSAYTLASSSTTTFAGAATFTNVLIAAEPTTSLTTTVNAASNLHPDNTNLLGTNLAWWYGDATTPQTQALAEQAGLNLYRFPGGSSSDDYHFNVNANYNDSAAENMPQFVQFIQAVNGTGMLTLDYGSGSPQEAAAEMAYLLGSPGDTTAIGSGIQWNDAANAWENVNWNTVGYWASLRAASPLGADDGLNFMRLAHAAPFSNIKYWEIGNEEYGSWEVDHHGTAGPGGTSTGAQHDPATYAAFAKSFQTFATEILAAAGLPAISIGIDSGDPTGSSDNNWTRNVLTQGLAIGFVPGYISDHNYVQGPGSESDPFLLNDTVSNSSSVADWSVRSADYQAMLQQTLGAQGSSIATMATEFNSVYTNPGKQSTSLVNGLFVADSIGTLIDTNYSGGIVWDLRNGYDTTQNNSEALYGWREGGDYGLLGDPSVNSAPTSAAYVPYPSYFAEQLASKFDLPGGDVESAGSNYQDFHAYAMMEANGHLELMVLNTNPAGSLSEQFNLTGFQPSGAAQLWQYGETQDTAQSQSSSGAAALAHFTTTLSLSGGGFTYSFPAYSMTVIDLSPAPGPAPALASAVVGDGSVQRSTISSITITFNERVLFTSASFTLQQSQDDSTWTNVSSLVSFANPSADGTTWVISCIAGGGLDRTGAGDKGFFADGIYQLTLHGSALTDTSGTSKYNNGGDQMVAFSYGNGTSRKNAFAVLYGDLYGTGTVNNLDTSQLKQSVGSNIQSLDGYIAALDWYGTGSINTLDVTQFKLNYAKYLFFT